MTKKIDEEKYKARVTGLESREYFFDKKKVRNVVYFKRIMHI